MAVACKTKPKIVGVQPPLNTQTAAPLLNASWFDKNSDNAEFYIVGDSLQFTDDFVKQRYTVTHDTFDLITKQQHNKVLIIKLTKDSLIEEDLVTGEIDRYWKSK
jgi:hypothetical protein